MAEWKTYKLSEIGTVVGGATPSTSVSSYYGGDIPWLTPKDLSNFQDRYIEKGERNITQEGLDSCSAQLLPANTVLFSSRAPIGYVAIAKNPIATNQGFKSIIPNEKVDSLFLYYILKYNKDRIEAMGSGTTFKEVSGAVMKNVEISLPGLEEQRRIAGILSAIDDKIENNRRINTNLELQAQTLYKQRFVDNRSDDWEEKPLSEIVFFQEGPGIRNWQYVEKKGVRFINIRCINDGDVNVQNANMISEDEACGKYAHFLLEPLDIVMSCSGTLGRYAIIRREHLPLCLNTSVIRFRPAQCIEDYSFVYGYLSSAEFLNKQEEMACGSVQANFGPTHLKQIKIKVPPKDYRMKYNNVVMPIINTMLKNRSEINMLSSLRDFLLPKLMNGEIKL